MLVTVPGCVTPSSRAPPPEPAAAFICTGAVAGTAPASPAPADDPARPAPRRIGPPEVEALATQLFPLRTCISPVQVAATLCHQILSTRGSVSVVGRGVVVQDVSAVLWRAAKLIETVDTDAFAHCPEAAPPGSSAPAR